MLDGRRFRFSRADAGGYLTRQWAEKGLSWDYGGTVLQTLDLGTSGSSRQQDDPVLSVTDAEATEGVDTSLDLVVTVQRGPCGGLGAEARPSPHAHGVHAGDGTPG